MKRVLAGGDNAFFHGQRGGFPRRKAATELAPFQVRCQSVASVHGLDIGRRLASTREFRGG